MKKLVNILCAATVLIVGLVACQQKQETENTKTVDLRYRVQDSYELSATGAQAFTILVASTDPWTITSAHPDWCIIEVEEGQGQDAEAVHTGKAEATAVRVQYYDNTDLDDRTDTIVIASDYWVGKTVTVNQKGIAFLSVPDEDLDLAVEKAGGVYLIHVHSNQPWSSKVTDGDWVSIEDGASGNGEGIVSVNAQENPSELRYAEVTVYDRHQEAMALIKFTQDGVQLVPAAEEIRAGYDQTSGELDVTSNTKWTVSKATESDTWFTLETTSGEGDGKILLTFEPNNTGTLRQADIVVKNVVENEGDYQAEKTIVVKQAYKIEPTRYILDNDELSLWKSDWANQPVYTKGVGTLFTARARLNRSMPFGTYTFRWSSLAGTARVRHWFCFSDGIELKADIRPASSKVSFDFNAASSGASGKPGLDSYTNVDFSQPVEFTYKFDPSGANFCQVTYLVNGEVAGTFVTSDEILHTVTWGTDINMYFGVDEEGGSGSTAICEWYEYTAPMSWE